MRPSTSSSPTLCFTTSLIVQKALTEIRRALKPGGHLVAATNGMKHLQEMDEWFERLGLDSFNSRPFTLENGLAQLQPFFSDIQTLRYP
jgi:SAM-dependent methyltransferase